MDDPLHIDAGGEPGLEGRHGGQNPRSWVDQGHVEIEPHNEAVTVHHQRIAIGFGPWGKGQGLRGSR